MLALYAAFDIISNIKISNLSKEAQEKMIMPQKPEPKKGDYLHAHENASMEEKETRRLTLLNQAYAPKTQKVLEKVIKPSMTILEIGVGTGVDAERILTKIPQGTYVGIDKDPAQLEIAAQRVKGDNVHLVQADAYKLNESQALRKAAPNGFNLIFCRWVMCHILDAERARVLQQILSLLAVGGIFICEEPNYHSMALKQDGQIVESSAVNSWKAIVEALQPAVGLNLELVPDTLNANLAEAIDGIPGKFKTEVTDEITPELVGEQKESFCLGIDTTRAPVTKLAGKTDEELDALKAQFADIARDDTKTVIFYRNVFTQTTCLERAEQKAGDDHVATASK